MCHPRQFNFMPRGKKQTRKFAGGIVRKSYHRPNRRENKSTHKHSHGRAVQVAGIGEVTFAIPRMEPETLREKARADQAKYSARRTTTRNRERVLKHTNVARMCVDYLRHQQSTFDALRQRAYGQVYLNLVRAFCEAVIEVYPWLEKECNAHYQRCTQRDAFRVVKVIKSVTSMQVDDINERANQKPEIPLTEEEEVPLFFNQLSSLDQERFLYLPPFLKPWQVAQRRFGENANDRWWEWEEEFGLESNLGRPIDTAHIDIKRRRRA